MRMPRPHPVIPAKERQVGSSPGRSLNVRGTFNLTLISCGKGAPYHRETPASAGVTDGRGDCVHSTRRIHSPATAHGTADFPRHRAAPARTCSATCSAGHVHLLGHLLCWIAEAHRPPHKSLISHMNLPHRPQRRALQKNIHLQKQVEQVKSARETTAITQQNAVQGCDPASFGPRRDVK